MKTLNTDKNLKAFIKDSRKLSRMDYDIEKIKSILEDDVVDEAEFKEIHLALGFSKRKKFERYISKQAQRVGYLEATYNLSGKEEEEIEEAVRSTRSVPGNEACRRMLENCLAIARTTALVGHLACVPLDLFVFPSASCHAGVIALQSLMQYLCEKQSENCVASNEEEQQLREIDQESLIDQ